MTSTTTPAGPVTTVRGLRLFADDRDQPRRRRATDAFLLASTLVAVAMFGALARPEAGFSRAIGTFLRSSPPFALAAWQVAVDAPLVIAACVAAAALLRRRPAVARDMLMAAITAGVVGCGLIRVVDGAWPDIVDGMRRVGPPPLFPIARLTIAGAALVTASPHLVAPARTLQRWTLAAAAVGTVALGDASPTGAAIGVLLAVAAASLVHLAVGSSAGRPSLGDVGHALAELGVPVTALSQADAQPAGVFVAEATGADGHTLLVKVYGRDAHDTALLATLWRHVWLRDPGASHGVRRIRQVEHEAFVTLLARQQGILTDLVVTAAATESDDAVLVLRRVGRPVAALGSGARGAAVDGVWPLLASLHAAGIRHGELDLGHLVVDEQRLGLSGFRTGTVIPPGTVAASDQVQALVTVALVNGTTHAIRGAVDALGPDAVEAILPLLQTATLTAAQRRAVRAGALDLDALRREAATAIGIETPKLQQLRRFTVGSVLRIALPLLTLWIVASAIADFDMGLIREEIADATWWIVLLALVVAQLPRLAQAVATLGASPVPLPLGPVYALQLAVSYINLAIPSTAARLAVNIRFFQRHGVGAGGALAAGGLDGLSGLVVQVVVLVSMLAFGSASLDLDLSLSGSGPSARLVLLLGVGVAVVVATVVLVHRLRSFVLHWVRQIVDEAVTALRGLRSPRRLAMLFGGNLASELLFASALGLTLRAFGADLDLGELLFVNVTVSLLAGIIPIPGGIGVTEGGLIYGLVSAGVTQETAFAAVVTYRVATFYLPPIWGFVAFRWLERNQHL